ncbi:hypothetical protein BH11MYX3_BH11MYX3_33460 [soil metagenome]
MLRAKALFAIATVVIAGTFIGLLIKSRGPTDDELQHRDALEKFGEEQSKLSNDRACRDAVAHAVTAAADYLTSRYGDGAPEGIRELAVHRCTFDEWPPGAVSCLESVTTDNELQRCISQLPEHHRRALEAEMKAFARNPPRVPPDAAVDAEEEDLSGDPYSIDPVVPDVTGVPPACVEYEQTMEKLMTCDKFPQVSRDALKQAFDAMKANWAELGSMPQAAREAMDSGCKAGVDALKQTGAAICGW